VGLPPKPPARYPRKDRGNSLCLFLPPFVVWTIHVVAAVEVRIACHDFVFVVVVAVETFAADVAVDNDDDDNKDDDDDDDVYLKQNIITRRM
jgi:hypothetical protein